MQSLTALTGRCVPLHPSHFIAMSQLNASTKARVSILDFMSMAWQPITNSKDSFRPPFNLAILPPIALLLIPISMPIKELVITSWYCWELFPSQVFSTKGALPCLSGHKGGTILGSSDNTSHFGRIYLCHNITTAACFDPRAS